MPGNSSMKNFAPGTTRILDFPVSQMRKFGPSASYPRKTPGVPRAPHFSGLLLVMTTAQPNGWILRC
ncbi:hypothetical protein BCR37DRAFT_377182 [Protomyces lactucae-debilis]|uniref:Uncharacterized protein n=1 Tax=Protomyces lactucae-debilis TaxID=2754530 RepID=A0A1Y2FNF0_PROLT|nr:uncharacterized protein BCR37DRAFT_377182 [Protomyces lactucae-debilis]ORY85503.1 hypothetical protein BCR37DRAFT_377182 [Protomyces lactucae-debilis]